MSPNVSCLDCAPAADCRYVQLDGTLGQAPVYQSHDAWGEIYVKDMEIVPSTGGSLDCSSNPDSCRTQYQFSKVYSEMTFPEETIGFPATRVRGDLYPPAGQPGAQPFGGDNNADVDDISCILDIFAGAGVACPPPMPLYVGDVAVAAPECFPNGVIDVDDILEVLDAFSGVDNSGCSGPCAGARADAQRTPVIVGGEVHIVSQANEIRPGARLVVDLYLSGISDIRAYQLALDAVGGTSGRLELESLTMDFARADAAFHDVKPDSAIDRARGRLVAAIRQGSADATQQRYLASFTFRASSDATGVFSIGLRQGDSHFRNSVSRVLQPEAANETTVSVSANKRSAIP